MKNYLQKSIITICNSLGFKDIINLQIIPLIRQLKKQKLQNLITKFNGRYRINKLIYIQLKQPPPPREPIKIEAAENPFNYKEVKDKPNPSVLISDEELEREKNIAVLDMDWDGEGLTDPGTVALEEIRKRIANEPPEEPKV